MGDAIVIDLANLPCDKSFSPGYTTIIRRPSQRIRPGINVSLDAPPVLQTQTSLRPRLDGSTEPSSFQNSRSVSTGNISTAKTSLASSFLLRAANIKALTEHSNTPAESVIGNSQGDLKNLLPTVSTTEEPVTIQPTIKTVETTTNAKVFFETHFEALLSGAAQPRAVRKQTLEEKLAVSCLTPEQRREERRRWLQEESDHLRQSRALKSKTLRMLMCGGVSVADFEIIKVLGKGSFGVVRLVRERPGYGLAYNVPTPRGHSSISKSMNSLISTIDGKLNGNGRPIADPKTEVFAMKVIRKSDMLRNSQEGHLRAERDYLVASEESKWVVPLLASFQDRTNLYLVMEYMIGGDFLSLLIKRDRLEEKRAQFYIAEMVLCLEEAHRLRWIHRDVKPDNFLISASGHLKISDFGLAFDGHWAHDQSYFSYHRNSLLEKLGIRVAGDLLDRTEALRTKVERMGRKPSNEKWMKGRHHQPTDAYSCGDEKILQWRDRRGRRDFARSVVGTSQYMAPEVIKGERYDGRCDWWSVGIILFEVSEVQSNFSSRLIRMNSVLVR